MFSFVDVNQFIEGLPPKKPADTDAGRLHQARQKNIQMLP
jgi:hypothetical protein